MKKLIKKLIKKIKELQIFNKIKTFLLRLRSVVPKIFALFSLVLVIGSLLVLPSFAASEDIVYQTIAPISFSNFSGDVSAVAFPGAHSVILFYQTSGVVSVTREFLNNSDYFNPEGTHLSYKSINGVYVPFARIYIECNYSSISVNSVVYNGTLSSPNPVSLTNTYEFIAYSVPNSYSEGQIYKYALDIILSSELALESARNEGYQEGFAAGRQDGYNVGYNVGYNNGTSTIPTVRQEAYNDGFDDGVAASDSQNLGKNLLGDTLNMPFQALNNFILYESASGFEVTLGLVIGGAICLTLFIAFLKIFAGG